MSTLRYAPGERLHGSRMRSFLEQVSDLLVAWGWPPITVVSGDRAFDLQVSIFLSRYVRAGTQGSRKVYDFQWWNGVLYARVSAAGRVAPPSRTAPHVAYIAADLGSPYNVYGAARNALLAAVAALGLTAVLVNNGTGFGEVWHWEVRGGAGVVGSPAGGNVTTLPTPEPIEEKLMEIVIKAPNGIVVHLAPGVKHDFANAEQYHLIRGDIEFIRARGGTDAMELPPLEKVVGVTWDAYKRFCAYFNVPTG